MASTLYGLELFLIVELTNAFQYVTRLGMIEGWAVALLLNACALAYWMVRNKISVAALIPPRATFSLVTTNPDFKGSSWFEKVVLGLLIAQFVLLVLVAYLYPPSNYDSMTYHLARVMHWIQNQSVNHYASNIVRQIEFSPFAEYNILNLLLLSRDDRFVNFPQLWAMLICAIGASDIATRFGADRKRQWLAALLVVSIPMAIMQSTSTQNDLTVAAWLIVFTNLGLLLLQMPGTGWLTALVGVSLGLGLLTKVTMFIFALPISLYFGVRLLQCMKWKAFSQGAIILALGLLINSGYLIRNQITYGDFLGSMKSVSNQVLSPSTVASNLIRGIALSYSNQGDVPLVNLLNKRVKGVLLMLHGLTSLSPIDPRTSLTGDNIFESNLRLHEDFVGGSLHTTLLIFLIAYGVYRLFAHWNNAFVANKTPWLFLLLIVGAFIVFSTLLKFQIWQNRLTLPLFVLACPVLATLLPWINKNFVAALAIFFGVLALNYTFINESRLISPQVKLVGSERNNYYFVSRPDALLPFNGMSEILLNSHCKNIGLKTGEDRYEYPIWALLKFDHSFRIEHILVENATKVYEPQGFEPCAVIADTILPQYENKFLKFEYEGTPVKLYIHPEKYIGEIP